MMDWLKDLGFLTPSGTETKAAKDIAIRVANPPRMGGGRGGRRGGGGGVPAAPVAPAPAITNPTAAPAPAPANQ